MNDSTQNPQENKVISLSEKRRQIAEPRSTDHFSSSTVSNPNSDLDFAEQLRLNREAEEKRRKEREKANQSVLKSYKIKT